MSVNFDITKLSLSKPYLKDNGQIPKHYIQYLRYQNGPLHFQSALFYSNGPKIGLNKGYQLCVTLTPEVRQSLHDVELFVAQNLKLLSPFAETWQKYQLTTQDSQPYKFLYGGTNLFMKMGNQLSLFNMDDNINGKYQTFERAPPLGAGWYIVYFSVPSVFIGSHNSNPKVASLQLRIEQIVYRPKPVDECHIQPVEISSPAQPSEQALDNFINDLFSDDKSTAATTSKSRKRNKKGELKKSSGDSGEHSQPSNSTL